MSSVTVAEILSNNYPGVTNNGNYISGGFDLNSANGTWKGVMFLGENTDGSLTFSYWDQNFLDSQVYSEMFSFVFQVTGGLLDASATASTVAISTFCSCGTQGPFSYNLVTQSQHQSHFGNANGQGVPVLTSPANDGFFASGSKYFTFRYRLYPKSNTLNASTAGMTIKLVNISHWENGQTANVLYNDRTGQGFPVFTLRGATPVVIPPTLVSVNPTQADRQTQVTVIGTNLTPSYSFYIINIPTANQVTPGTVSLPATVNPSPHVMTLNAISTTQALCVVPASGVVGPSNIYASNGTYTTNTLPFTVTGLTLYSDYSAEASLTYPAPVATPSPLTLVALSITPQNTTTTVGLTTQFTAIGTYTNGTTADLTSQCSWGVKSFDGAGSIGVTSGLFVAIQAGQSVTVFADFETDTVSMTATANVVIAQQVIPPSPLVSINVYPPYPIVLIGQTEQFFYQGINAQGTTVYPNVSWAVQNGDASGSIDQKGLFTAVDLPHYLEAKWWQGVAGNYLPPNNNGEILSTPTTITQVSGNIFSGTAPLSSYFYVRMNGFIIPPVGGNYVFGISSGDGANLYVNGQSITLNLGNARSFSSSALKGSINLVAGIRYPLVIEWGVGAGGDKGLSLQWQLPGTVGLIPVSGIYIEGDSPNGLPVNVIATAQDGSGVSGSTTVTITAPPPPPPPNPALTSISISPKSPVITSGSTQQFVATSYDQYGNPSNSPQIAWSIVNINGSGIIDPQAGLFTAEVAGTNITVIGTSLINPSASDSSSVIVIAGALNRLVITPGNTQLQVGEGQQFTVTGYDRYNNAISLNQASVLWTLVGGNGTISSTGAFTATNSGTGKVIASYLGFQTQAGTNILQNVGGVIIASNPQQPFARVHIRDVVSTPILVDTRKRGGGLVSSTAANLIDEFWWDLSNYDGPPFHLYGVYVANASLGSGDYGISQTLAQAVLAKYGAPQFLGIVTPGTQVPLSLNPLLTPFTAAQYDVSDFDLSVYGQ